MSAASLLRRLHDGLASLRLAVTVMLTLGLTCLGATLYESKHGTEAVQRVVYKTPWFALILVALGINIFSAMMKRYPFKKHHTGFVMAHIGILLLLAGSLISLHYGLDSNMALFEGESSDRVALLDRALQVSLPDQAAHGVFPVDFDRRPPRPGREPRFAIPGTEVTLVAEAYEPHVRLDDGFEAGTAGPPALHFILDNPFAREESWLVAGDATRGHVDFGPASVSLQAVPSAAEAARLLSESSAKNEIRFAALPDGTFRYGILRREGTGAGSAGPVVAGQPIETPWMGMKVQVEEALAHAVTHRTVVPEPPPEKDERRMPAVRVHLEGPKGRTPSEWLAWTEARGVAYAGGEARLAYRAPEQAVPFRVSLLKFQSKKYPGSNMPATYESWVRVEDADEGVSEHHISMNHPLHYRGYIFFQASFVEGQPMMSIFSVSRAPGLPLVYVGVTLITAGVVWMFYVKPYLAKRQAARALEAHRRALESRNEPSPADAVAGRSGPAEPASSRA